MAYTQSQLDALDAAIASGAMEVRYENQTVKYRSIKEMTQLRNMINQELNPTTKSGMGFVNATHSKGLD